MRLSSRRNTIRRYYQELTTHDHHISVDPHKESGQNLYRQYAGKKGKIVLNARWVHECVKAGVLQTFHSNWAGCKVDGTEVYVDICALVL